jgi:enoyl-CoA hydratase/carnithine racemase
LERNIARFMKIWDHPKPVIAAVHGYCLAGATQLCVFTDVTVVAEDAKIGLPSIPIGGGYITPLWTPLVGPKRAKQMSFVAGSQISDTTASEWGWANYAVPADELLDNVRALATEISRIPSEILRMKKLAVNRVAVPAPSTAISIGRHLLGRRFRPGHLILENDRSFGGEHDRRAAGRCRSRSDVRNVGWCA